MCSLPKSLMVHVQIVCTELFLYSPTNLYGIKTHRITTLASLASPGKLHKQLCFLKTSKAPKLPITFLYAASFLFCSIYNNTLISCLYSCLSASVVPYNIL